MAEESLFEGPYAGRDHRDIKRLKEATAFLTHELARMEDKLFRLEGELRIQKDAHVASSQSGVAQLAKLQRRLMWARRLLLALSISCALGFAWMTLGAYLAN